MIFVLLLKIHSHKNTFKRREDVIKALKNGIYSEPKWMKKIVRIRKLLCVHIKENSHRKVERTEFDVCFNTHPQNLQ